MTYVAVDSVVHELASAAVNLPPTQDREHGADHDESVSDDIAQDHPFQIVRTEQQRPEVTEEMVLREFVLATSQKSSRQIHRQRQSVRLGVERNHPRLRCPPCATQTSYSDVEVQR